MAAHNNSHHGETARQHMVARVSTASAGDTAGTALAGMTGIAFDYAGTVYVLDAQRRLLGAVPITALLAAQASTPLAQLTQPPPRRPPGNRSGACRLPCHSA